MEASQPVGVFEHLVHAHVKDVYDHLLSVYPSVDPDITTDAVFLEAERLLDYLPAAQPKRWLFGIARKVVARNHGEHDWKERNAAAVVEALTRTAKALRDWHAYTETERVIRVVRQMPVSDQDILRLISCMDDLDVEDLAGILDIDVTAARTVIDRVTATFDAAFLADGPSGDG
jgi:DNA-directed RNA polymerase specialized sigma24 family protein